MLRKVLNILKSSKKGQKHETKTKKAGVFSLAKISLAKIIPLKVAQF